MVRATQSHLLSTTIQLTAPQTANTSPAPPRPHGPAKKSKSSINAASSTTAMRRRYPTPARNTTRRRRSASGNTSRRRTGNKGMMWWHGSVSANAKQRRGCAYATRRIHQLNPWKSRLITFVPACDARFYFLGCYYISMGWDLHSPIHHARFGIGGLHCIA